MAVSSYLRRVAANRGKATLIAGIAPMVLRFILLPVFPIPQPRVHDEFSYLLLGDTLAHGRLSNPTPLFWEHFETEYELLRPTYASQYEPAQGVVLAAGKVAAGHPWWGVWLSVGGMCAALCWALGFAVPPAWALFGSLIAGAQFGVFGFWMNSYFGGAVPAIGGALVFASLTRRVSVLSALIGGVGIAIVLASRPAEGCLWLIAALYLMWRRATPRAFLAVFAAVLAMGIASLGMYNYRVTGSALTCPYSVYRHDYGTPQSYWWQDPVVVTKFRHAELEANYKDQLRYWDRRYSVAALWNSSWHRIRDFWRFFVGPFLTPAMVFAFMSLRRRRLRRWLWVSGLFIFDHATYHAWYPQQSASETILIVLFLTEGWRRMYVWRRAGCLGRAISGSLATSFAASMIFLSLGLALTPPGGYGYRFARIWDTMHIEPSGRDNIIRRLEYVPGKHLVFVRYSAGHLWSDEWVFNGADIPGSRIVFARMCSPQSDLDLVRAMSDRDVWIANPEQTPLLTRVVSAESLPVMSRNSEIPPSSRPR